MEFFYRGNLAWTETLNKELPATCIPPHFKSGGTAIMTNVVTEQVHTILK